MEDAKETRRLERNEGLDILPVARRLGYPALLIASAAVS